MAFRVDYKSDENDDLLFENGDLVFTESDSQHWQDLIASHVGAWKESPLLGVGLRDYLNAPADQALVLERDIRLNLTADGYVIETLKVSGTSEADFLDIKLDAYPIS